MMAGWMVTELGRSRGSSTGRMRVSAAVTDFTMSGGGWR